MFHQLCIRLYRARSIYIKIQKPRIFTDNLNAFTTRIFSSNRKVQQKKVLRILSLEYCVENVYCNYVGRFLKCFSNNSFQTMSRKKVLNEKHMQRKGRREGRKNARRLRAMTNAVTTRAFRENREEYSGPV